jgi:hypothetical protein
VNRLNESQGLEVRVGAGTDADPEELERLTAALRRELLDVDTVDGVSQPAAGTAPPGSRAIDPLTIGTLLVTLVKSAGGLRAVTRAVQGWLSGQPKGEVTMEIDGDKLVVSGVSTADQERLITAWIERHARE